jgi:hypothetical protein
MLFVIQPSAMEGVEAVLDALDAILVRVEDEVHEMEVIQAEDLESSAWYRSSRPLRQRLLQEIAQTSFNRASRARGPHMQRVDVSDPASAERGRGIAYTPLVVLAENDVSDGALIEAAVRMFEAPQAINLCFGAPAGLDPPAFQIESRGGYGELKKLLARRLDEATTRGRPARLVVVTDSDGEWPGEVKPHALEIRNECVAKNIRCPPLNKRTAENYIPDAVWRAWASVPDHTSMRPAVAALLRLSPDQRDHVHMAAPGTNPWNPDEPQAVTLFQGVSIPDRNLLKQAGLKGRGDTMMILALRDHTAALTTLDLQARDHHGDLMTLVRHIEDEL